MSIALISLRVIDKVQELILLQHLLGTFNMGVTYLKKQIISFNWYLAI